jgi:hypothetical protein
MGEAKRLASGQAVTAVRAEATIGLNPATARGAGGLAFVATLRTKATVSQRAARGTAGEHWSHFGCPDDGVRIYGDVAQQIGRRGLVPQLDAHSLRLGLGVRARQLFLEVGGALFAQADLGVPARFGTHPMATTRALVKMLLAFDYSLGERRIVRGAADGALNLIRGVSRIGEEPAE